MNYNKSTIEYFICYIVILGYEFYCKRGSCTNHMQEVRCMATKSILKDVNIKDRKLAHTFVKALDDAKNKKYEQVQISRKCRELPGEKIKAFFDKK